MNGMVVDEEDEDGRAQASTGRRLALSWVSDDK